MVRIRKCAFTILVVLFVGISFVVGNENHIISNKELKNNTDLAVIANINTESIGHCKENFSQNINEDELKCEIERIYNERSETFVSGKVAILKSLFDTSQRSGRVALEREIKRVKYLNDWGNQRNITFVKVESIVRVNKVYPKGSIIKMDLEESNKFNYIYNNDDNCPINSFGIGIRHTTNLVKKDGVWVIYNDWFNDCFEDALNSYANNDNNSDVEISFVSNANKNYENINLVSRVYDRQKAANYADKYCGAAWGSGNEFRYNNKYNDYKDRGGDCANYVSQVLVDKEGGGIPNGSNWFHGSKTWINAEGLKNYLISSGKGYVMGIGTLKELIENSHGAIGKIQLGDLVGYEKIKDNVDHFSVVTGFDSHGYPLVNSHTTDRYHVPWDLGWNSTKTRFYIIHINK